MSRYSTVQCNDFVPSSPPVYFNLKCVQCLLGVHYDDYNYQEIEEVLDTTSKDYIKMCCSQTKLRPSLAQTVFAVLPHTDLVQLSVIVMEARNLSEILFVLKSVMKYMS